MAPTAAVIGFAAPLAMFLAGCSDGDDVATQNIAQIAGGAKELSTLVAALAATNLTSAVADTQDITVFAPTNDAFDALGQETLSCLLEPVGLPKLADVLKYHVVPVKAKAADLTNDESLATLDEQNLTVMLKGDTVTIKGGASSANVTTADIMATNGVVHEIDGVLIPKDFAAPQCGTGSIADTAVGTKELKTLVTALSAAGLVDTFNGTDVFTVFAPTDDAFAALGNETIACLLDKKNKAALTQVLTYHVVAGYDLSSDITDGLKVDTLETEKLTFTIEKKSGKTSVMIDTTSNGTATVVTLDVFATNGVVHVIDAVLIPEDFVKSNPCSPDFVAEEAIMV